MLNGCKYCYCCNGIQRARQEQQELYASISTWSPCPFSKPNSLLLFLSHSTNWYPCPCPLLAHSRRTTVLLSGSIMRGSTRWGRGCSCFGGTGEKERERVASMWLAVSGAALVATDQVASYLNVLRARLAK